MKSYIVGIALFIVFMIFTFYQYDYNMYQEQVYNLKFVAEEAAAAAAQYVYVSKYAEGDLVFNYEEGILAAEYIISKNLKLDDNFFPKVNTYWQEQIKYNIYFFDDSNSTYPVLYEDIGTNFILTITEPTVVIKINAGKPRYKLINSLPDTITTSAHEWKGKMDW